MKLEVLLPEEAEQRLAQLFRGSIPYTLEFILGKPVFRIPPEAIRVETDFSVTWTLTEVAVDRHVFLELTTGEEARKTVYLPFCLVNPASRKTLWLLAQTAVNPTDGRMNSKAVEMLFTVNPELAFAAHCRLPCLTLNLLTSKLMPLGWEQNYKSRFCPSCKQLEAGQG